LNKHKHKRHAYNMLTYDIPKTGSALPNNIIVLTAVIIAQC